MLAGSVTNSPSRMHRPSQRPHKEGLLGHVYRSTPKASSVDHLSPHGRFRRWTLPPHLHYDIPASLTCDSSKRPAQEIFTSSESSRLDERSSDAHSSSDDEAKQSATTECPRSSLDGSVPSNSSSSGRARRRSSSGDECEDESWRTATTFLRLSDSRKLARNRRLRHPHKWIRTCHMPPVASASKTSRVRLIVSEEISSSYSYLFSRDDVWEPYDPESYQDNNYLTIPRIHRDWWRSTSLDRISELSQTSLTANSSDKTTSCRKLSDCSSSPPTDLPPCSVCRSAPTPQSVEPPVSSDGVEIARAPACSRLFKSNHRLESGDKDTRSEGRNDRLRRAVKEIQSRSSAVAQFIVALERKKPEVVPPMLYRNLEAIQRKLQDTHQAINGMSNSPRKEQNSKSMAIAKSADSVVKFLQSTIAKSVETLRHLENLDAVVCQEILSEVSSILTQLKREGIAMETETKQTITNKPEVSLSSDSDLSAEHGESDATSTFGAFSPRSLPRRQTHRKSQASRRRRCPHAQKFDKSLKSVMAYRSDRQTSASDWLSCHKAMRLPHLPHTFLPEIERPPLHEGKPTLRSHRSKRVPKPIPHNLCCKCSIRVPPKRMRYLPELPPRKPRYHLCAACRRPHRLLSPIPFEPDHTVQTCNSYVFDNPAPGTHRSAPNFTDTKTLPDDLRRNLPNNMNRHLPDNVMRNLPDDVLRNLPDNVRRNLPDNLRRNMPDSLIRDLPDKYKGILPDNVRRNVPDSWSRNVPDGVGRNLPDSFRHVPVTGHGNCHNCQSSAFFAFPERKPLGAPSTDRRNQSHYIPQYPVDNSRRRLPTCLARQRLKLLMESQQPLRPETPLPSEPVFSGVYNDPSVGNRGQFCSSVTHYPCCHYRNVAASRYTGRYVSSPDETLSHFSASSAHRARTARSKIRKGRSNIVAVRSDDGESESSEFGETSSRSKVSGKEAYTVVLKCAQINVYVDKADEQQSVTQDKSCSTPVRELHSDMQSTNRESEEKPQPPPSACTSCREGVGDQLFPGRDSRCLYNSCTRMKVSPTKGDAVTGLPRRRFKRVSAGECDGFAMSCDKSERLRRMAKPADVSRTESSSESSVTRESTSSSPLESDWSASSSSSREDFDQLEGKTDGESYYKEDATSYRGGCQKCRTSVSGSVTNAPRPLRRWLVLGSEWTPPSEEAPMQAVFDTPSQTAPLICVKGNDFGDGTKRDIRLTKEPADSPSSSVAFPVDVTCSYTTSGHRIESCVASYVFAQPGSQGLPVPLEASVVPPDEEEIANLSFQRVGTITPDGKSPPKPLVVFPQSVDSILSPSGHHLESCCARFVFLNDKTISRKSSPSGCREQPDTTDAEAATTTSESNVETSKSKETTFTLSEETSRHAETSATSAETSSHVGTTNTLVDETKHPKEGSSKQATEISGRRETSAKSNVETKGFHGTTTKSTFEKTQITKAEGHEFALSVRVSVENVQNEEVCLDTLSLPDVPTQDSPLKDESGRPIRPPDPPRLLPTSQEGNELFEISHSTKNYI